VHDTVWFEINKKPSVFVASSEFIDAAEAQSKSLGLPEVKRVFVPHPIQDRTDDEMRERAEAAVDALIEALVD
jgi:hypothetical protein